LKKEWKADGPPERMERPVTWSAAQSVSNGATSGTQLRMKSKHILGSCWSIEIRRTRSSGRAAGALPLAEDCGAAPPLAFPRPDILERKEKSRRLALREIGYSRVCTLYSQRRRSDNRAFIDAEPAPILGSTRRYITLTLRRQRRRQQRRRRQQWRRRRRQCRQMSMARLGFPL